MTTASASAVASTSTSPLAETGEQAARRLFDGLKSLGWEAYDHNGELFVTWREMTIWFGPRGVYVGRTQSRRAARSLRRDPRYLSLADVLQLSAAKLKSRVNG